MRTRFLGPVLCALLVCSCTSPRQSVALSPDGHGQLLPRPAPAPIAWRSNALAAPCALECHDALLRTGIAGACHALDSIYHTHLEQIAQARASGDTDVPPIQEP